MLGEVVEHGGELLTGNAAVRAGAVADTVGHRPVPAILIPGVPRTSSPGITVHAGQDRPEHGSGHGTIRGKGICTGTGEVAFIHGVVNELVGPVALRYIREGLSGG